jgi:hypothetical protein
LGRVIGRQKFKLLRFLRYWISDLLANLFLPIFEGLLPDGVEFGTNLLVEFESDCDRIQITALFELGSCINHLCNFFLG